MKKVLLLMIIGISLICVGCSPEGFNKNYDKLTKKVGEMVLTSDKQLKGKRIFGENNYLGKYSVEYDNASSKEVLFGGTSVESQKDIHIKITINNSKGTIKIIQQLQEETKELADKDGTYEYDFEIKTGSNYLVINTDNYSGNVNIEISKKGE